MSKGKIVLVPFPFTDLSGHKVRPALILHVSRGEDCIVAFISSGIPKKKYPFDVLIKVSKRNGLKSDSVIKVDKIATLQKKIVLGELGVVEGETQKMINQAMRKLFAL
jgi:mRNA interferase MazF